MVINEKNMILLFVKIRQEGGHKPLYLLLRPHLLKVKKEEGYIRTSEKSLIEKCNKLKRIQI